MIVSAIGPDVPNEGEEGARHLQQRAAGIAVLDAGWMGFDKQRPPIRVDQGVALAAFDLLAGIIATRPASFGGLDALASLVAARDARSF